MTIRTPRHSTGTLLALLVCGAGCDVRDPPPEPVQRDSAGVTIVESHWVAEWSEGAEWRIEEEPTVSIGEADGEAPYLLSYLAGALRLDDGRIVVANHDPTSQIRVYDEQGRHQVSWGGTGEGPGELRMPPFSVYRGPGGELVVPELGVWLVHRFDLDGTFIDRATLEYERVVDPETRVTSAGCCAFAEVLPDGNWLILYPEEAVIEGSGVRRGEYVLGRFNTEGEWLGVFTRYPGRLWRQGGSDEGALVRLPLTASFSTAVQGEEVFVGNGTAFQVDVFDAEGVQRRSIRLDREPPPFTDELRERYIEWQVEGAEQHPGGAPPQEVRSRLQRDLPDRLPAFSQILIDPEGRLWLIGYQVRGADDEPRIATILWPDGRLLGQLALPPGVRPLQVGDDWILGQTEDELGVVRVVLHGIERGQ